jgi:methionyl-tRNA formyltransferase
VIKAAFLGTPEEAVPVLEALGGIAEITVVITRPDRPQGRSGALVPPPVKVTAIERGWRVAQPSRSSELAALVVGADVAVVAAYGRIIPEPALAVPVAGFVNVHFSLLPRWRGASPVVRAILAGDEHTGATLMAVDAGLDTGATYAVESTPIDSAETAGELTARLAQLGAGLVVTRLGDIVAGRLRAVPQPVVGVTAAGKVTVEEAYLDPVRHRATPFLRAVRAFNPKPGAWSLVEGRRVKVWKARPAVGEITPGMAELRGGAVLLGVADGAVELVEVQPPDRATMSATAWMNGRRGRPAAFAGV